MNPHSSRSAVRAMRRAFARLPDLDRDVFVRVRFEGQDYDRIALDLGTSVAEVERAVARVMVALDAAASRAERRFRCSRYARICAWLIRLLPQGWRR